MMSYFCFSYQRVTVLNIPNLPISTTWLYFVLIFAQCRNLSTRLDASAVGDDDGDPVR